MADPAPARRSTKRLASWLVAGAVVLSLLVVAALAYTQRRASQLSDELMGAGDYPEVWTVFDLWGLTGAQVLSDWAQESPQRLWIPEHQALVVAARYRQVGGVAGGAVRVEPLPPPEGDRGVQAIMVFRFLDNGSSARYQPIHQAVDIERVSWLGERIFLEFQLTEAEALERSLAPGDGWRASLTWHDLEAFVQPRVALPGSVPGRSVSLDWLLEKAGATAGGR